MTKNPRIIIHKLGPSFRDCTRIESSDLNEPGPGEVLVRHHFVGVNGVYDQMMCLNRVEHTRVDPPAGTGVEAVGEISAIGPGVARWSVGDPVAVVRAGYGYRHYQVCPAASLISLPQASPEMLAIIPSGISAVLALEQVGEMGTGETVLITAAAGGLGSMATQWAVQAGNHVIAVCGSAHKARWLESVGVARVIQYREESLGQLLAGEYADRLDLVIESVGGDTFDAVLGQLAPHGRLVVCGYTSDRLPTAQVTAERVYTQLYWKAASVRGFMNYRFREFADDARARLIRACELGRVQPLVDPTPFRGLASVPEAVEHLLAGNNLGKVVVDLRSD
jgi:NADPH-dependent curcumin reductase CurA